MGHDTTSKPRNDSSALIGTKTPCLDAGQLDMVPAKVGSCKTPVVSTTKITLAPDHSPTTRAEMVGEIHRTSAVEVDIKTMKQQTLLRKKNAMLKLVENASTV